MSIDHSDAVGFPAKPTPVYRAARSTPEWRRVRSVLRAYGVPEPKDRRALWRRAFEKHGRVSR